MNQIDSPAALVCRAGGDSLRVVCRRLTAYLKTQHVAMIAACCEMRHDDLPHSNKEAL